MTVIPFRGVGTLGLNSDLDPRTLPTLPQFAWTDARNVSFERGSIVRGPRFRQNGTISLGAPQHVQAHAVPNGTFEILVGFLDGTIRRINARDDQGGPCLEDVVSPITHRPFNFPVASTTCTLEDVVYWNRPDHRLWYMMKNGERFLEVPNWGEDWRCRSIRAFNNVVVAISVSRGGRTYPCMVKTSDITPYGTASQEWVASTENNASENLIGALADKLVDGLPLRGRMFLYTPSETWVMTPTGTTLEFTYDSAFPEGYGIISQNCAINVQNRHFVMGEDKIWTHDGSTQERLSKGRFDEAIFTHLVYGQRHQFFAVHNPRRSEVMFCFVSSDPKAHFPVGRGRVPEGYTDYPGCNMAFVYNYTYDSGSLYDLPYLAGGGYVSPYKGKRWEEFTTSWADTPENWEFYADHTLPTPVFVSAGTPAPPPAPEDLQAVDDAITITSVKTNFASGYRSSTALTPNRLLTSLGFAVGETVSIVSNPILKVAELTTIQNLIDTFNATPLSAVGYQMGFDTRDQPPTGVGQLAILRNFGISNTEMASLDTRLFVSPEFITFDFTNAQEIPYLPGVVTGNDIGVDPTTRIVSITQPQFFSARLDAAAQTIYLTQPLKVANGHSYGNHYSDSFTYTIQKGDVTSTANVAVTIDNGTDDLITI